MQVPDPESLSRRVFTGRSRAAQRAELAFQVPGRLQKLLVDVGDRVREGELLAALDPRDFANALRAAEAEEKQARAYRDRIAEAHRVRAVSDQALTDAESALYAAQATLKLRRKALEDSRILAPFDGDVTARYLDNFEVVDAKQPVLRVLNASRIEMVVNIPESAIGYAPFVRDIRVRFDAFPDVELQAEIVEIGDEASGSTRTYPLTLAMDPPEGTQIDSGMTGRAVGRVVLAEGARPPAFYAPTTAILAEQSAEGHFVWVVDAATKQASRRSVRIGEENESGIRIEEGLEPGEWIATAGGRTLVEGQQVEILDVTRGAWRLPMPQERSVSAGDVTVSSLEQ